MYILDSDTTTHFFAGSRHRITSRILATHVEDIYLPAIVAEEQLRGRLKILANLNPMLPDRSIKIPAAYDMLLKTLGDLQRFQILPYTRADEELFQDLPAAIKRLGTRDCRIATTAINNGMIVITCNTDHFQQIPNVQWADWSM